MKETGGPRLSADPAPRPLPDAQPAHGPVGVERSAVSQVSFPGSWPRAVGTAARVPRIPPVLEHCDHCQAIAPPWDSRDYGEWYLGVTESGVYLGVICSSCFCGEQLAFISAQAAN